MRTLNCPFVNGLVELTDEREEHIASRHPDLLPWQLDELRRALAEPDDVKPDPLDDECMLFIRWADTIRGGRHVIVAVRTDPGDPPRHWIATAYTVRRLRPELR